MESYNDIKKFILKIENDFPVNNWTVNDIHLWPYIRIRLFFHFINIIEGLDTNNGTTVNYQSRIKKNYLKYYKKKIKQKIKPYYKFYIYNKWIYALEHKEYFFLGADAHRVNFKGKRYNRYFDTLIEKNNWFTKSFFLEYNSCLKDQFNSSILYKVEDFYEGFKFTFKNKTTIINLNGYDDFILHLKTIDTANQFTENYSRDKIISWVHKEFLPKKAFFETVLKKVKPSKAFILCYYSQNIFPFTAAANNLGIETIEMQHGPQADTHLCYGSWFNLPEKGYIMLPKTYWCWDSYSMDIINDWANSSEIYKVKISGNPWIDFWKSKAQAYKFKDYILYTLQPEPNTLEQMFCKNIVDLIKKLDYKWFIRLHPRQLHQLNKVRELLKFYNIEEKVNLEQATNDPLPQILLNTKLHITHTSGSTLEASYFNVKTLLINSVGLEYYPHLIKNNLASYIDYEDVDFIKKVKLIINGLDDGINR
tara:strand:- start:1749 stop:3182 length:1434 start_codon:yes stop_codon:yes gene_type:complete